MARRRTAARSKQSRPQKGTQRTTEHEATKAENGERPVSLSTLSGGLATELETPAAEPPLQGGALCGSPGH